MHYNHIQICEAGSEKCVVKVDLVAESKNLHGHIHGGLLYGMADCAAGVAARVNGDDFVTQSAAHQPPAQCAERYDLRLCRTSKTGWTYGCFPCKHHRSWEYIIGRWSR